MLVILGLLVGGVLSGQALIRASEKRSLLGQHSQIVTAVHAFREKYFCLPGDCPNMNQFFNSTSQPTQVTNGNGDGKIDSLQQHGTPQFKKMGGAGYEYHSAFDHLAASGLYTFNRYDETIFNNASLGVDKAGTGFPEAKFRSRGTRAVNGARNYISEAGLKLGWLDTHYHIRGGNIVFWTMCAWNASSNPTVSCGLIAEDAWEYDTKMDDGKPYSGKFYILAPSIEPYWVPGASADYTTNCASSATREYNLTNNTNRDCAIAVEAF